MDIYSFSDLLYALAKQENEVLKSYGIQHRPTIGNQYFAQRSTKNRINKICTKTHSISSTTPKAIITI